MSGKSMGAVLTALLLLTSVWTVIAQEKKEEASKAKLFLVHEDIVKPSKVAEYEKATKAFQAELAKHDMTMMKNIVVQNDEMVYSYVYELENMAALDQRPFGDLREKMGDEAFQAMWDAYDNTIESHKGYMVTGREDLSYMPAAMETAEEMNFRHFDIVHFTPGKSREARQNAEEWKALYESKKSTMGYRTYVGGIGTQTPMYIFVARAKNEVDFYTRNEKNRELLGAEGEALWKKSMTLIDKFEHVNGRIRPDLSYMPAEEEALTAK